MAAALASLACAHGAIAADATWTGATDATWSNPANWSPASAPGSTTSTTNTDTATFNSAGNSRLNVTVDSTRNIGDITFDTANAAAYKFSAGNLLLSNGGQIQMSSTVVNPQLVNTTNITIEGTDGAQATFENDAASSTATLALNGAILPATPSGSPSTGISTLFLGGSNTGANVIAGSLGNSAINAGNSEYLNVAKVGDGTWELNGNESYSGATNVYSGTLLVAGMLSATKAINVGNGTLDLTAGIVGSPINILGTGAVNFSGGAKLAGGLQVPPTGCGSIGNLTTQRRRLQPAGWCQRAAIT